MMLQQEQTEKPKNTDGDAAGADDAGDGEGQVYRGKLVGTFAIDEDSGTFSAKMVG